MKKQVKGFEVKFQDFGEAEERGTASALLSKYGHIDHVGDVVVKGAYTKTIDRKPKIPMLADHDMTKQCGIAELVDSDEGLRIKMTFFLNTELGREKYELTKASSEAGLPMGTSIGYRVVKYSYGDQEAKQVTFLEEIDLHEASITPFPCCEPCLVDDIKSKQGEINVREIESNLRDAGLSKSQATKYSSLIKSDLRDAEEGKSDEPTDEPIEVIEEDVEPQTEEKDDDMMLSELKDALTILNLKTTMENF